MNVSAGWVFSQMGGGMLHCVDASFVVGGLLMQINDILTWRMS